MDQSAAHIDLPYVSISYKEPIVSFIYKEGTELGFPEIKELIAHAEQLSSNKPYITLNYAQVSLNITNEGKRYMSNTNNMPLFRGTAAIVKNSFTGLPPISPKAITATVIHLKHLPPKKKPLPGYFRFL
jgi:hypothetical protein